MPIFATVNLRGSCPKKKNPDLDTPEVGYAIDAGSRIPSTVPRYIVEQWLGTKHAVRVDPDDLDEDQNVRDDYWDDFSDWPKELGAVKAELNKDGTLKRVLNEEDQTKTKTVRPANFDAKLNREAHEKKRLEEEEERIANAARMQAGKTSTNPSDGAKVPGQGGNTPHVEPEKSGKVTDSDVETEEKRKAQTHTSRNKG